MNTFPAHPPSAYPPLDDNSHPITASMPQPIPQTDQAPMTAPSPPNANSNAPTALRRDSTETDSQTPGRPPRLTEAQKKANHIESERKRRERLRAQFDRLSDIIPGMEGKGRSEAKVLEATVKYSIEQVDERRKLIAEADAKGIPVDAKWRDIPTIPDELREKHNVPDPFTKTEGE